MCDFIQPKITTAFSVYVGRADPFTVRLSFFNEYYFEVEVEEMVLKCKKSESAACKLHSA